MNTALECEMEFSFEHIPLLVEYLTRYAYKWRDLGVAFKFQPQDLKNIETCPTLIATGPSSFLQRLVEEWLEGRYPYTAPPTLANLLKALNSHTVGLGTLATEISDSLPAYSKTTPRNTLEVKVSLDQGVKQISDIRVHENIRVHLIIEADSHLVKGQEWKSKGLVPINEKYIREPVLKISADVDRDGSLYFCDVRFQAEQLVTTTTPVTLRVSCPQLDKFKKNLASIYLAQPEVPEDSWPPVSNKAYINLALIKQQKINYGGEYARFTIRGDMDDILRDKEKINYKNIFDGLRSGSLFLIEGRPGSGKTTLIHKITRDWAASEVQGPMRLVLLVSLRILNNWNKPVALKDLLQFFDFQENEHLLKERQGSGVCFIFDGLDEFSPIEGVERSLVYKIITKTYLPQAMVVVASRPVALAKLRQRADKVIEIVGFPRDQIFEYVENYPFSNISKVAKLKSYLLFHPNVLHMCYLPIHAAMVAFLFEVTGEVPRTETDIYTHFTRFTLMRSLSKTNQDDLEDIHTDSLSGEEKASFEAICKIAFEKTKSNEQVLDQDKIQLRLKSKNKKDISLGLVTVDRTAGLYGFKNIYTFLHLTYQEYLAACHISSLSDEDQQKLIKQYGDTDHMQVVWKFYCGLVDFEDQEYKVKELASEGNEVVLHNILCAYESQQEVVCECLVSTLNAQIFLKDKHLSTKDYTALGYLLGNSHETVSLSLINCNTNTEAFEALLKEIGEKPLSFDALHYESSLDQHCLKHLKTLVTKAKPFTLLDFSASLCMPSTPPHYNEDVSRAVPHSFDFYGFSDIVSTTFASIKEFSLTNVLIGSRTLANLLQFCEGLKSLTLSNSIKEDEVEGLIAAISELKEPQKLSCTVNFTDHGTLHVDFASSISSALPTIPNDTANILYVHGLSTGLPLTLTLEVCDNRIFGPDNVNYFTGYCPIKFPTVVGLYQKSSSYFNVTTNIARGLSNFSALERLMLSGITLNRALSVNFAQCTLLRELDLTRNFMGELGGRISGFFASLKNCSNLEALLLSETFIRASGARALASCLQYWPALQELDLKYCDIQDGARAIVIASLNHCTELAKLDLSCNSISAEDVKEIESELMGSSNSLIKLTI